MSIRDTEDYKIYIQTGIYAVQTPPLYSRSGKLVGMISTHWDKEHHPLERELRNLDLLARQAADLIEQVQYKEQLRNSEKKYRTLFEHMNDGFFLAKIICDDSGRPIDYLHLAANPALEEVLGIKRSEILGKTRAEVSLPPSPWIDIFGNVALTGESTTFEGFSEGLKRYFMIKAFSPKQGQFACLIQDITERRRLESELKYQKELFESVVENMHESLIIYNKEKIIEFLNAEGRKLYGHLRSGMPIENTYIGLEYFSLENNTIPKEDLPSVRVLKREKIKCSI